MADITIKTVQFKRGSEAKLIAKLKVGELGVPLAGEPVYATDTHILKIGDGITDYEHLPAITGGTGDIDFIIHDPQQNQILVYDASQAAWKNQSVEPLFSSYIRQAQDAAAAALVSQQGAAQAQQAANNSAQAASNSAANAIDAATRAEAIPARAVAQVDAYVNNKLQFMSVDEYNDLEEIDPDTFYFVRAEI